MDKNLPIENNSIVNNSTPFVSVLIITYHTLEVLKRALIAIQKQTFKDYEVIVVDDGSDDNTVVWVNSYIKEQSQMRIKLIVHPENRGIVSARNTALDAASGKYCYIHDADDWMDEDCLQVLADKARENNADRIVAEFRDVDVNGKILQVRKLSKAPNYWLCTMHDASLYKRSVIKENNIRYEEGCWDDLVFNFKFSCNCRTADFIHKPIFNYYINPNSTSGSTSMKKNTDTARLAHLLQLYESEKELLDEVDQVYAQYYVIKYYYAAVLLEGREMDYRLLCEKYMKLRKLMNEKMPKYQKNKNIHLFKDNGERFYGRSILWGMTALERLGLFKLAIRIYLMVSKVFYLNA